MSPVQPLWLTIIGLLYVISSTTVAINISSDGSTTSNAMMKTALTSRAVMTAAVLEASQERYLGTDYIVYGHRLITALSTRSL